MHLFQLLYFMLPAYAANMAPFLGRTLFPTWNTPLDFRTKIGGKRLLGSHKTVRGVVFGISAAIIITFLQNIASPTTLDVIDYSKWIRLGILLGLGALLGDAAKSIIKRQLAIAPGKPLYFIDQIDYVLGAIFFASPLYFIGWNNLLVIIIVSFILTVIVNHLAYALRIRHETW